MAELEEAKKKRLTAKKRVTQTAGKLVNAVELGQAETTLAPLMQSLDSAFELFNDTHEEYLELSPDEDSQSYYNVVRTTYMNSKKAHLDLTNLRISKPTKISLVSNLDRAGKLLSKIDSLLEGDDCEIHLLTDITDKVDTLLVDILKDKMILDGLGAGVEEGARAHEMVVRFDDVKLQVQSRVRQYQSASVTCASPAGSLTSVASVSNGQTLQQPQQGGAAATMPATGCSSAPPDGGAVTISVPGPSDQVSGSGVQSSVAFMTPATECSLTTQGAFVSSAATQVVYSSGLQQSAAH